MSKREMYQQCFQYYHSGIKETYSQKKHTINQGFFLK